MVWLWRRPPFISGMAAVALYSQVGCELRPSNSNDRSTDRSVELCKMGRARGTKGTPAPGTLILNLRASSYVPIPDSAPAAVPPPPAEGRAPPCLQLSLTASNIFTFCMESW